MHEVASVTAIAEGARIEKEHVLLKRDRSKGLPESLSPSPMDCDGLRWIAMDCEGLRRIARDCEGLRRYHRFKKLPCRTKQSPNALEPAGSGLTT